MRRTYDIQLDDKYGSLTVIDIPAEVAGHEPWFNQTLTTVNDAVVRLGIIEGDFHWHKHDDQDEFFLVLDGELLIDLEDRDTVVLGRHSEREPLRCVGITSGEQDTSEDPALAARLRRLGQARLQHAGEFTQ
jgi:hypothetical protein